MKRINWGKLLFAILLCESAGIIGSLFTISSIPTWYSTLTKPPLTPPSWVFGPVWILLYLLMGISFYIVLTKEEKKVTQSAITLFLVQLALNALWTIVFFGMKNIVLALVEILVLLAFIRMTTKAFRKIDRLAGNLLIPYLLWTSFATYLTFAILFLNL